jgi:hypothetical protein
MGRWILDRNRASDARTAARLDGFQAVLEGRSRYVAYDPRSRSTPEGGYTPGREVPLKSASAAAY